MMKRMQCSPMGEDLWRQISAQNTFCLSCNACRADCAVHSATGRLQPLKLVRLANLGLIDELLLQPETWYCLQCNHCSSVCPMEIKPAALIRQLRQEALTRGVVGLERLSQYEALCARFHRARWHMAARARQVQDPAAFAEKWQEWADQPIERSTATIAAGPDAARRAQQLCEAAEEGLSAGLSACMTCRECTTACPLADDPALFDPARLLRMAHLGLDDELLGSPAIWLCLGCQRCSQACTQNIKGHRVIQKLQRLAIERDLTPGDMHERLWEYERALYPRFLRAVDVLFGFINGSGVIGRQ